MNTDMVLQHLRKYNEDELFYKEYYNASKSDLTLRKFIASLDKSEIIRRHLLVKEIAPEYIPYHMDDNEYFDFSDSLSIF